MKGTPILAALVLACLSIPVSAQSPEPAGATMTGLFPVYVLDRTGEETKGKLVSLTGSAVVLQMDSATRTFNLTDVVRIYRQGDSLKNGAIIGAAFGGAMGILTGGLADCPDAKNRSHCPGTHVAMAFLSTGLWSAIGVAIDALIPGRTLIWRALPQSSRPSSGSGLTLAVSPQNRVAFVGWRIR